MEKKQNKLIFIIGLFMLIYAGVSVFIMYRTRGIQGMKGCINVQTRQEYEQCQKWYGYRKTPYLGELPLIIKPRHPEKIFLTAYRRRYDSTFTFGIFYFITGLFLLSKMTKRLKGCILVPVMILHLVHALSNYQNGYLNLLDFIMPIGILVIFSKEISVRTR